MENSKSSTREAIIKTKIQLQLLEELELLDSEFRLIENEYLQRTRHLEQRLKSITE